MREKRAAVLRQMALYVKANIANFRNDFDTGMGSYYESLFREFTAKKDGKFTADEDHIRYNLDAVIEQAKTDCGW